MCNNLPKLGGLHLSSNQLNGQIPSNLCKCRELQILSLSLNGFNGSIPREIGNLTMLKELYLGRNNLKGVIPSEIGNLQSLEVMNLIDSSLTGFIPSSIFNISSLRIINFSNNSLSGSLPVHMCNHLLKLGGLYLSRNQLNRQIPSNLYKCKELQGLSLSISSFNGCIPREIGNLTNLKELYLDENNLEDISTAKTVDEVLKRFHMVSELEVNKDKSSIIFSKAITQPKGFKFKLLKGFFVAFVWKIWLSKADLSPLAWRKFSYQELLRATEALSETNLVGKGSYGSLYKGMLSDGMTIAVKVFNLQLEGAFKSFDVECEVLRNIRHRNLIKIMSSCCNMDFKALVLEYMPNGILENWLYSHNYYLDILQRLNIMIDVASALKHLHHVHTTPIIHCDLKPSNVLLDENMIANVADFGIAKLLGDGDLMVQTMTLATIGYMAPEYGIEGRVLTRYDAYSFGVLLMETFTRKKPTDEMFAGELSLKRWVNKALEGSVIEIVDTNLIGRDDENFFVKVECVSFIFGLVMDCSNDSAEGRINMIDALARLKKIKTSFVANIGSGLKDGSNQD
ncbi:receptor kinase-like protein Xa21 [Cornus florida]|uniref:receptor kinase-like protein Xa21 n=1 Tax=Cornus florida TaxID=4283 RepID=UPI0028A1AE2F|nr:receptor kinase-like protein Xa21 [Cornus florida]